MCVRWDGMDIRWLTLKFLHLSLSPTPDYVLGWLGDKHRRRKHITLEEKESIYVQEIGRVNKMKLNAKYIRISNEKISYVEQSKNNKLLILDIRNNSSHRTHLKIKVKCRKMCSRRVRIRKVGDVTWPPTNFQLKGKHLFYVALITIYPSPHFFQAAHFLGGNNNSISQQQ